MPPSKALEMESRILPVLALVSDKMLALVGKTDADQIIGLASAMMQAPTALGREEFTRLLRELCEMAAIDGRPVIFDQDFAGSSGTMLRYRVAWFVLEANYADFFAALLPAGRAEGINQAVRKAMDGDLGSTGDSGDPAPMSDSSAL